MNLTIDANILVDELTCDGNIRHSLHMQPALTQIYIAGYT